MKNKERYKEVFSQIESSMNFDPEKMNARKPKRSVSKRTILLAATIAVLTGLCFAVYEEDFLGLRALLLSQTQGQTVEQNEPVLQKPDEISLAGCINKPESQATAEWRTFLSAYKMDRSTGNDSFAPGTSYAFYQVYNQEMADKLDEIADRYSLKLHTLMMIDLYTNDALCDQVGGDFLGENRAFGTYMYEDGTFKFDGEISLDGNERIDYNFMRCVRGSFTDWLLNITDSTNYIEWTYTTQCGIPVRLALAPTKALVFADMPDSFVTIDILAGSEVMAAADLEHFADSFDFSVLTPVRPADPSLPRPSLDEVLGKPSSEDYLQIAGLEESAAQDFFAEWILNIENGNRQAVAEKILYPAKVVISENGSVLREVVVKNAEEVIFYYDAIFTESLWESIQHNRYDLERSDLRLDNGMVCGAGGMIWFAYTENNGIKVITVQNNEGYSIQQP